MSSAYPGRLTLDALIEGIYAERDGGPRERGGFFTLQQRAMYCAIVDSGGLAATVPRTFQTLTEGWSLGDMFVRAIIAMTVQWIFTAC
jgi:hypothetical protein